MNKNKKILLIAGIALVVVLALALTALLVFGGGSQKKPASGDMDYTVLVKNSNDTPLEGIGVYVYEDETKAELVWFDKTNEEGKMFFTAPAGSYVAVLGNVPTGYAVLEHYAITEAYTEIILSAGVMSEEDMKSLSYKLGDLMMDFTVADADGVEYTLSELLKTKKAVVLNFWYLECVPCQMEFPFMQEAYEKYKDDIEILAMNPVNTDADAIAKFKQELGLTFPMMQVDALWEQMMGLTAYPTTVVIDRFGNISLMHRGSIDSADTFEQIFAYFTAEDYEAKAIESIDEIVTKAEGSEENPSIPTDSEFEVTLEPGEIYFLNLYKITEDVYLTVKGQGDFVLTYKNKEYTPRNGSLTITINSEGPSTPVELKIQNTSEEKQTYYFYKSFPKGSSANPYKLSLGEFDISTGAGNEKGTFGTYTAEKSGTLTVRCLRNSVSKYGFYLYNLRSYAMRNADEDGKTDEDGYLYVSVQVKKGDQIQFSVAVARDDSNNIPSGSFRFELILKEGDGEEEKKETLPTQSYTIKVTDDAGKPVSGVSVNIKGDFTYQPPVSEEPTDPTTATESEEEKVSNEVKVDKSVVTDESGVVTMDLVPGPYIVTVAAPAGYKLEQTEYELTDKVTSVDVKLKKLRYLDYTVKVLDPYDKPVSGVVVLFGAAGSSVYGNTDKNGVYKINQLEGEYTVSLYGGIPDGYAAAAESYSFPKGGTALTIKLIHKPGSAKNPIKIEGKFPFYTGALESGKSEYYTITGAAGMTLRILDESAQVTYNGKTYQAVDGMVTVEFPQGANAISLHITNKGEMPKSYRVNVGYPMGHKNNPVALDKAYTYITTRGLNKGESVYYSLVDVAGKALIISDPDAAIIYGGKTYTAQNGAVTVVLGNEKNPLVAFCNNGSDQMEKYSVRVGYPWGTENNPVVISDKTTLTTRVLSAGEGVWYTMSGVAGMELTIADENAKVIYGGVTYEAVDGVVTVQIAKDDEAAEVCFVNGAALAEGYSVRLEYPIGAQQNPIVIKGVCRTFETVSIPAGETVFYKIKDVAAATVSVGENAMLSWNGSEAQNITIPASTEVINGILGITNNAQEDSAYTVSVSFDEVGTRQNPEVYTSGQMKKTLAAGDADGYYYSMTAAESGTLTVTLAKVRGYLEKTTGDFDVILYRNGTAATPKMTDNMVDGESKSVSIQVAEGDDVRILLIATADADGAVPKKMIAFTAEVATGPAPTDDVNEDAYVDPGVPYVEADDPNGKEDATEFVEPPEVIEEEGGENQFLTYTVTVTDYTGKAMGNVIVQLMSGNKVIDGGMTNAKGLFYTMQAPGDYTVSLSFSSSGCYYEDATAVLSPSVTSLKIPVTSVLPGEGGIHWNEFNYKTVGLGGTYLAMQSNVVNYYGFKPTEQGTYRIQLSDPSATITYWGTAMPNDLTENTLDYIGNAFTLSIPESMIDGTHYIGVTGVPDGIMVITRLGDAQFNVNELPWVKYVPQIAPAAVTNLPTGKNLVKVDITKASSNYKLVYNDSDKYYHLGSATGPVMYVQLAADKNGEIPPFIHINAMVGGVNANMATAFRWAAYDDKGNYVKEDYTDVMLSMCDYAEANDYGVYPLTKDVMYMIQQCGQYLGWWDPTSENYKVVFSGTEGINLDIIWMFACCYFQ